MQLMRRCVSSLAGVALVVVGLGMLAPATVRAITISAGSATVPEGTSTVIIPVSVSGGGNINTLSLAFAVGDGGPVLGGSDNVPITVASITGGIFDVPAYSTSVTATPTLPSASASIIDIAINQFNTNATAEGLIVNLTLDTSGLLDGASFTLRPTTSEQPTNASSTSGVISNIEFQNGLLTIVPEPTGLALLALAAPVLLRGRRG